MRQSTDSVANSRFSDSIWSDLDVARAYLQAVSRALDEAAESPVRRVVALGLDLIRHQGQPQDRP